MFSKSGKLLAYQCMLLTVAVVVIVCAELKAIDFHLLVQHRYHIVILCVHIVSFYL